MKISKLVMVFALGVLGTQAFAGESQSTAAKSKTPVDTYTYDMKLDIQKVITVSDIPDQCGPVPAQMTYEDSQGQRHILQYQVMGTGCSNG
ncbi:DUF2790 domain-containing protein [Pseudomonas sp. PDM25]|jgi:hypothetical protein|uniref:DUF2790 domain-containing protein n=1 Tax=Pseudomonas sp. PDM25 TaxID=2854772 RepID=UPI001C46B2EC|nr:DUF2790 domain-containing protein [Pseudomonas sp. PDM25]MBV7515099.1 DUF2790 domain-containing protein [Pseudomonas sp. PDM25]